MSRLRIRSVKPEFFADERVNSLPVPARYLTLGLITRADDRGRQRRQDAAIAAHVFPEGDVPVKQVTKLLELVVGAEIALGYVANGHGYLWLPNFWKHQRINRPSESDLPPHPDDPFGSMNIGDALAAFKNGSVTPHAQFTESSRSTQHSRAVPIRSLPIQESPQGLSRERVTEAQTILATRWPDANEVEVENAAAMYPAVDVLQGCRLAVTWAAGDGWETRSAGATLRSALRKLDSEKPKESVRSRRGAALKGLLASTEPAA